MDYQILIIDDDKDLCVLIKQYAAREGISADYCHSGLNGLEMLDKKKYHLILLDVMMPGMDGFQTLDKIRSKSNIPILMLTAKDDSISKNWLWFDIWKADCNGYNKYFVRLLQLFYNTNCEFHNWFNST